MKTRLALLASVTASLLAVTACTEKKTTAEPAAATPARIEVVRPATVDNIFEATGTVRSRTSSNLSAKMMGNVTSILAVEGDRVRAGQLLLTIDSRDVTAQLSKANAGRDEINGAIAGAAAAAAGAEANQTFAEATYKRYVALKERRSVSPQEFDEVEAKYRGASAQLEAARQMHDSLLSRRRQVDADISAARTYVSYAAITAPIDGIVTSKFVDVGAQAAPGMPLLRIEDERNYQLEVTLDESQLGKVQKGQAVTVRLDTGGEVAGQVREVSPALDPMTRSFTVKIDLPPNPALRSGIYGRALIPVGTKTAVTVPATALVRNGQLTFVYAVDREGAARLRLVKTGPVSAGRVEILSGLDGGENIVADGVGQLRDGVKVSGSAS